MIDITAGTTTVGEHKVTRVPGVVVYTGNDRLVQQQQQSHQQAMSCSHFASDAGQALKFFITKGRSYHFRFGIIFFEKVSCNGYSI